MNGIVYVLTNPAMPNLVKIGRTTKENPQARIDELYNTSVPVPFHCEIAVKVEDEVQLEKALFELLHPHRTNPSREFFEIDAERLKPLLSLLSEEDVTPEVNSSNDDIDIDSKEAGEKLRKRRPNLNFEEMGIPVESEIVCIRNDEIATVVDERRVNFRDEIMYLTRATTNALGLQNDIAPCPEWSYQGRSLQDIYDETHGFE